MNNIPLGKGRGASALFFVFRVTRRVILNGRIINILQAYGPFAADVTISKRLLVSRKLKGSARLHFTGRRICGPLKICSRAIRLNPTYFKAYSNRAVVYLQHGNKEPGCNDAQKACAQGLCRALTWAKGNGLCL